MYQAMLKVMNLGVDNVSGTKASKVKLTNITSFIACSVPLFYSLYYLFQLEAPFLAAINIIFVAVYALPLLFSYLTWFYLAKIWIFASVMTHTFLLATVVFTSDSGFHYYYLLLPSCLFLLFDDDEKYEKPIIMAVGLVMFFFCEFYQNMSPMVVLSESDEKMLYSSTLLVVLLEIYLITYVFSRHINRNESQLQDMAARDALTGLGNRRTFLEIGQALISEAQRYEKPLTLLLLDIDHFKKINDEYGHLCGDRVLKQMSQTLKSALRDSDMLARYGGEEFVIILPETNISDAQVLAEKLRSMIETTPFPVETRTTLSCTASIGVAEFEHRQDTLNALTHRADQALYQAKASGRNKVCF